MNPRGMMGAYVIDNYIRKRYVFSHSYWYMILPNQSKVYNYHFKYDPTSAKWMISMWMISMGMMSICTPFLWFGKSYRITLLQIVNERSCLSMRAGFALSVQMVCHKCRSGEERTPSSCLQCSYGCHWQPTLKLT